MNGVETFLSKVDVSRETLGKLELLEALLRKWSPTINLVSPQTLATLWTRHFLDSAQLFDLIETAPTVWSDLGSGGGFPGLVIGILAQGRAPQMRLVMVESDKRKAAFLTHAARELGMIAQVEASRIEAIAPLSAQVLSARALAPLDQLLGFAERHLAPGGVALFPKGARWRDEVALAQQKWSFSLEPKPSAADANSVVLKIMGVQRV